MKESIALDAKLVAKCGVDTESAGVLTYPDVGQHQLLSPYISSTFDDFEEEFKHLHTVVFPKLRETCKKRGVRFDPVDFRRTCIENRVSSEFTLTHALDSINKCCPFFMAIFGQKYGPHKLPTEPLLNSQALLNNRFATTSIEQNLINAGKQGYSWVLEKQWQLCSLLELEIQAAALEKTCTAKYCFFYIRDFKNTYMKRKSEKSINEAKYAANNFSSSDLLFEAESEYAERRLNDLKTRIVKKGWSVKYFSNPAELGTAVLHNWTKVINQLFPILQNQNEFIHEDWSIGVLRHELEEKYFQNDELEKVLKLMNNHVKMEDKATLVADKTENEAPIMNADDETFIKAPQYGDGLFSTTRSFIKSAQSLRPPSTARIESQKNIFVLVGDPGSGKSALISRWLRRLEAAQPDVLVISEFIGASHVSRDIGSFLRRCVKTIRELRTNKGMTCSEFLDDTKSYSALVSAFQESIKLIPCILVIDSLNDLKSSMNEDIGSIKRLSWLPEIIPPNCCIVLSTRRSDLTYKAILERKDVSINWMPTFTKAERIMVLKIHLTRQNQNLGAINSEKIVGNRLSEKPLYLTTLAGLISSCTNVQEVDQVIERCTELRTFRDFWRTTFNLWTRRFSWTKGSQGQPGSCRTRSTAAGWIGDALRLVASSRNGLLPSEILHILSLLGYKGKTRVTTYDWMVFQRAAKESFTIHHDGTLMFSHTEIRHATKFYLLGAILPTATASAASLGSVNLQQHYHSLLSSYFVKYGSLERKMVELPWQLEQGADYLMMCQVLGKPRFFQAICRESEKNPYLNMDMIRYWSKLNKVGFNASHFLRTMVDKAMDAIESGLFSKRSSGAMSGIGNWHTNRLGMAGPRNSVVSAISPLKRPSMIIVTLHDDVRAQSTVGSRSEIGDTDIMSESGSCSFFITETEADINASGWSPIEDDPEQPFDESAMDNEESCQLNYDVCMFLQQLGNTQDAKDGLLALSQELIEMKPLSGVQQIVQFKTLCSLAVASETDENTQFVRCLCEEALEIYDSISVHALPTSNSHRMYMLDLKISACLILAQIFIDDEEYETAENILKQAVDSSQEYQSSTMETNITFMCAKLFVAQGLCTHAETLLKRVFTERLQWYGPLHITVASVLCELGDLYAISSKNRSNESQRISLLAYKQASHIFQHNYEHTKVASVLHKIGSMLKKEGSLCSTKEAKQCLEQAMDMYMTQSESKHDDINCDLRKLSIDLMKGQYQFGSARPPDVRTDERPYSTLSWHDHELKKMLRNRPYTAPTLEMDSKIRRRTSSRAISAPSHVPRPYSAYCTSSYGKRVSVSPKHHARRKVSSAIMRYAMEVPTIRTEAYDKADRSKESSKLQPFIKVGTSVHGLTQSSDVLKFDGNLSGGGWINQQADSSNEVEQELMQLKHTDDDENKEMSVVIIPAGRQSRISVKLEVDNISGKSVPMKASKIETILQKHSNKPHSEYSSYSGGSTLGKSILQIRHNAHRKRCHIPSGPAKISLTVHGSHSSVDSVLPPPVTPRPNVKSSGLSHKSAWYNVPGRYPVPGQVLPSKHKQVRPDSPFTLHSFKTL